MKSSKKSSGKKARSDGSSTSSWKSFFMPTPRSQTPAINLEAQLFPSIEVDTDEMDPPTDQPINQRDSPIDQGPSTHGLSGQASSSAEGISPNEIPIEQLNIDHTSLNTGSGASSDGSGSGGRKRTRGPNQGYSTPSNPDQRARLTCLNNGAFLEPQAVRTITTLIKEYFTDPWPTWKSVPIAVKTKIWEKFSEIFAWPPEETIIVKNIWENICKTRFRDLLQAERKKAMQHFGTDRIADCKGYMSSWIKVEIWDSLIDDLWGKSEWEAKSQKGKQNQLTIKEGTVTKHTGGSISFPVHAHRLRNQYNRTPTYKEVFDRTHKKNAGQGEYVDNKSKVVSEKYNASLVEKYGTDISSQPHFDPVAWFDCIGGMETTRTHVYGLGSSSQNRDILESSSSSASPIFSVSQSTVSQDERIDVIEEKLDEVLKYLPQMHQWMAEMSNAWKSSKGGPSNPDDSQTLNLADGPSS